MKDSELTNEKKYHHTKLLLTIFRTVIWRMTSSIIELRETSKEYGCREESEFLRLIELELEDFDFKKDLKAYQDRLMSISKTNIVIDIIDKAHNHLKTHPKHGQLYYDIIRLAYIEKEVVSDEEIWKKLNLSQSSYYRYKRKAIELMGVSLWGYIIPPLKECWSSIENTAK